MSAFDVLMFFMKMRDYVLKSSHALIDKVDEFIWKIINAVGSKIIDLFLIK